MVIQTCSQVFAVLMQMEEHDAFSADAIATRLSRDDYTANVLPRAPSPAVSNDRTTLPFQNK